MTHEEQSELRSQQLGAVEMALRPNGVLYEIAQAALDQPVELTPQEAGDVILKRKQEGQELEARWMLIAGADKKVQAAAAEHKDELFGLAIQWGNRKSESLGQADLAQIDATRAVWMVESGANRTSVVRRNVGIDAMLQKYEPEQIEEQTLFQFGGSNNVPAIHPDGNPNDAHVVAQEIAPDFLVEGEDFTEFGLNLATAQQAGFEIVEDIVGGEFAERRVELRKSGNPKLVLIQPRNTGELSGTENGFSAVANLVGDMSDKQLVIATNGQYRFKVELQAERWARKHHINTVPAVALGDEPGYQVEHNGQTLTTAERNPIAYLNDFIVLSRMAKQQA